MSINDKILRERYKIIRELSRGGMGVVYLAKDLLTNQPVAVKKSFFSGNDSARRGFEMEAKLLARLNHEGLPKVQDYFILESNFQALVMDYVEGATLAEVLESGKYRIGRGLDPALVTNWSAQILNILKYLHNFEPPVVHRDIKPSNIKINEKGKIILLDFGLAKGSINTIVSGKSGYSPIEQIEGMGTDPRSDIYSLGATLYHLLTDDYPLSSTDRFREINIHNKTSVERTPSEINPQIPSELSGIIVKAMALLPDDRFQTAREMKTKIISAAQRYNQESDENFSINPADSFVYHGKQIFLFDDDQDFSGPPETVQEAFDSVAETVAPVENPPAKNVLPDVTVASVSPLENKIEAEDFKVSYSSNSVAEFTAEKLELPPIEFAVPQTPSKKVRSKHIVAAASGIFLLLLVGVGILAVYLMMSAKSKNVSAVPTDNAAVVTAADNPKNSLDVSIFRHGQTDEKTILLDDYRFTEQEKFKFLIKSPADGFLYIISLNNQSKAALVYPNSEQRNIGLRANAENFFPLDNTFEFTKESPTEISVYFIVVPTQEDALAKRIRGTFGYGNDLQVSVGGEAGEIIDQLDKIAAETVQTNQPSGNSGGNALVRIKKIKKKL